VQHFLNSRLALAKLIDRIVWPYDPIGLTPKALFY